MSGAILALDHVSKQFSVNGATVAALADVTLAVEAGECLAIVGESGSGKTTLANLILGVYGPSSGVIRFGGEALPARRRLVHRRAIQFVQQNPLSALNPRRRIGASIRLSLDVHKIGAPGERDARVGALLAEVGLDPAMAQRFPSSLSGGQRQRVAIARALACDSRIVVLDEPTSALDVLVQGRVLRLLNELRDRRGLTYVFITHDLSVVRNIATRVAVFERGRLVELAQTEALFANPAHPYTRNLLAAVPVVTTEEQELRDSLTHG
ncbi:MAG: ATP-binding cassette domain-containing protein [Devosia sp.]|nr:ATP-binding cassette domain-containing protein [Devosia sp.]